MKGLTKIVAPSTISMAEAAGDTLFVLPLALWQFSSTGYQLDERAWIAAAVMGVVLHGDRLHALDRGHQARARRARHDPRLHRAGGGAAVRGVPASASCRPSGRWIGGALILGAGLLVVVFGRGEGEASVAAAAEPEPL